MQNYAWLKLYRKLIGYGMQNKKKINSKKRTFQRLQHKLRMRMVHRESAFGVSNKKKQNKTKQKQKTIKLSQKRK